MSKSNHSLIEFHLFTFSCILSPFPRSSSQPSDDCKYSISRAVFHVWRLSGERRRAAVNKHGKSSEGTESERPAYPAWASSWGRRSAAAAADRRPGRAAGPGAREGRGRPCVCLPVPWSGAAARPHQPRGRSAPPSDPCTRRQRGPTNATLLTYSSNSGKILADFQAPQNVCHSFHGLPVTYGLVVAASSESAVIVSLHVSLLPSESVFVCVCVCE